jgi:hypothetical protein
MNNCLRPANIPRAAYKPHFDTDEQKLLAHKSIPHSDRDPMPAWPGSLIETQRGVRRLLNDELARGQGTPKAWLGEHYPRGSVVRKTVAVHLFEYLSDLIVAGDAEIPPLIERPDDDSTEATNFDEPPFSWVPPDLSPTSDWTRDRAYNLVQAALQYEEPGPIIEDGMKMLERHRSNYTADGPKPTHLQLLWWEFPKESWDELREGCSMHFLKPPVEKITPNSEMTSEQVIIATEFVEELVSLGVLIVVRPGDMVTNGPLFCLPKPGQPGQWRILSDMRHGGQNEAVGSDPTVFPKPGMILDQLYPNGFSAVADASKYFYNFPTRPEERKYLGCIHLRNPEVHMVHGGLPMGAANSPSIAGRHGAALIRKVCESCPVFNGHPIANTWWKHYSSDQKYNPVYGHGMVYIGDDGLPAARAWGHCDDFFIHGPTYQKTSQALTDFMDLTVKVGLLCHPGKLTPSAQVVKYTGLILTRPRLLRCAFRKINGRRRRR